MRRGLLATRQELSLLRNRVGRRPFDRIYEVLRKRCALILQSQPITEMDWRSRAGQGLWAAAVPAVRSVQGRVFDLIISHHIDPNVAYRDRAIEEMKTLASWSTWTDPDHAPAKADLCTGEACVTMVLGLDWLEEDLSEVDRLRCLHALREKGLKAYEAGVAGGDWWYNCYHHWNAVINSGCGLAALALSDEEPHQRELLNLARRGLGRFFDALGREGGWDEGIGYWAYAMRYLLFLGEGLDRQLDDRTIFRHRGMDTTGTFGLYFSPRGQGTSFGESPTVPLFGALYGLSRRYGLKEVCWFLDRYAYRRDVTSNDWSDAGLGLLLRPPDMTCEPPPDMTPVRVFNEIGWAALADHWPEPSFYAAVKTGDLSANRSHLDMNSVQVQADGEVLLADLGNPPAGRQYFSKERYESYPVRARGHNTVIVGEREHALDGQGQIVEAEEGPDYRYVAGSAGAALGENVRFNRHVVMLVNKPHSVGQTVVVLDELTNALSEKVELFWHTFGRIDLQKHAGVITGQHAALHFRLAATCPLQCAVEEHTVGPHTDSTLVVTIRPTMRLVLATVLSRTPLGKLELRQTSRRDVNVHLPDMSLHFKGSRRHLQLSGISPRQRAAGASSS